MIYWFTGQPGSGKTTLAVELLKYLPENTIHLDGDNIRDITSNYDYTREGRLLNFKIVKGLCSVFHDKGFNVVVSLVSPYRECREDIKNSLNVKEIYLHTEEIRGKENYFSKDYEPPLVNFLSLDTGKLSIKDCLEKILKYI